ncbi:HAD family hydrolase [Anaerocolumna sp. MB42-C2]|uniref:HAD family hydrolase n=1 Tax=Anaerocolumna sp. MB42-C2 TaxID=3070997 RepID=UPI0027E09BBF|nr:HAD-IA family hydrolase [Anaerocolumna sp. MB42-C2]WMJ87040.1 HAD-IA family hydrolase [Anaerocolumna sp. MB42-C2]
MIRMIAFDFDGTIADTIPICIEAFNNAVSPYVGHKLTKQEIIKTFGLNEIGMVKAVVKDKWEPALDDFYFYYEKLHDKCMEPFPQIVGLIKFLKEKNIIVALITGKGQISCDISLKKLNLEKYFSEIMVGDERYLNKADSILKLIKKYAVKVDEFYYVGDAVSDVTACKEAGVICLSAAWSESVDLEKLKIINPGFIYYDIDTLKDFFRNIIFESS